MELTVQDIVTWIEKANEKMQANKEYLTTLDQEIGDGDHGINMARGFQEAAAKLADNDYPDAEAVLKDTAMTLMSKIGGASGPLFGTAFLKMSVASKEAETLDYETFKHGLKEAVEGIKQRGKATEGEKTLVDVWAKMADLFNKETDFSADKIADEANDAMEQTKDMMATKGRASYFKERSIGHIDPGSASSQYIFTALAEVIGGKL
ncbi:dihydroxyacetone kinase subunit DhaL [Lentibacillus amyloliquefaciens]|uniref:phosphoenolpyruvate--glycerone phosphotransferase n=1 Tax=Lentibacillus amyloliquefaciens TaxID=1472767 RepID=A0A0U4F4C9_9BACI|nr:dihydroxyacetone kinase subunit DhaL [Lentibacillus amyloliquefaciens]ALX50375.1 dihydroxyacetone kinase [Lentibacillus amyloliquefaciens]